MYNFILTKNEERAAQFVILEMITENFKEVKFKPQKIHTDLLLEFAMYEEKGQSRLTTKYRTLLEKKFKTAIPKGGRYIEISRVDKQNYLIKTDSEKYVLNIFLENGYLTIKKEIK